MHQGIGSVAMSDAVAVREQRLRFFTALSSPARVAIIDALKANGQMSEKDLGAWLVAVGDLAPQARPGLGRVHLGVLEDADLIEQADGAWRVGPGLAGGVHWTGIDASDVELTAAAQEFERVLTERRIQRIRHWARTQWAEWPSEWSAAAVTTDNIHHCTLDELSWLDERLHALTQELEDRVAARRDRDGTKGELAVFRTFAAFPWGTPPTKDQEVR